MKSMVKEEKLNNRYIKKKVIGKGGFGTVYEAFDLLLNCTVAIKEFDLDERMRYEADIMRKLRNVPYIARYRDSFIENGKQYIVMKYLSGQSLSSYIKRKRKIKAQELLAPLENILIAMEKMHELGYIHRDISPGNLFFTEEGELFLIDFGTATAIDATSPFYNRTHFEHKGFQAPENDHIEEQGAWTDIYSFCATIFYLFTGEGVFEVQDRVISDNVPRALLNSSLTAKQQNALIKGLQVEVQKRWKSAGELRTALFGEKADTYNGEQVSFCAGTDIGSREVNQDNLIVDGLFYYEGRDMIKTGTIDCSADELHLVAVCDGVGGAVAGELASRAVAQALAHFLEQHRDSAKLPERLLEELMDQINEKIISLSKKIGQTGSTLSILLWKGNQYYVVNIGDSPIFRLRGLKLKKLSIDQTMAYVKEMEGELPSRKDKHTLVHYMGKKNVAGSQMMSFRHGYINKKDVFLLCSDGITNAIDRDRLKRILLLSGDKAVDKMLRLIRKKPDSDNSTAVVVRF